MCETWGSDQSDFNDTLHGYDHFDYIRPRSSRARRSSGGVTVFVKDSLINTGVVKRIFETLTDCVVLLLNGELLGNLNDIIMIFAYVSPENSPIYREPDTNGILLLYNQLFEIVSQFPTANLFLAGDLNSRIKLLLDYIPQDTIDHVFGEDVSYPSDSFCMPRQSKDHSVHNTFGLSLIDLCCTYSIHVLNGRLFRDNAGEYTCFANNGASVVDYMIASSTLFFYVTDFGVSNNMFSVHCPVYCTFTFEGSSTARNQSRSSEEQLHKYDCLIWNENCKDSFIVEFQRHMRHFMDNLVDLNVTDSVPAFIDMYKSAADNMLYKRNASTYTNKCDNTQPPWWNMECSRAKRSKFQLLRQFRVSNDMTDLQLYKHARNKFKNVCKKCKSNYERQNRNNLVNARNSPKSFWSIIKKSSLKTNRDVNRVSSSEWVDYFATLLNKPQPNDEFSPDEILSDISVNVNNEDLNKSITESEILSAINHVHSNRASGPDGVGIVFYKTTVTYIVPYLLKLFNHIFSSGHVPASWGESIITPIHKAGSKGDPGNYRGISLINSLCKVFTCVINNRLQAFCNDNSILDESQAGFRKHYSTVDNIFSLMAIAQKYTSRPRGRFYCIFIDFSKAFDSIQHNILWNALLRKSIDGKMLIVLKSMYNNLKSCVRVGNGLSDFFSCNIGTRQGCICSPVIFCLFINDLVNYLRGTFDRGIFVTEEICDLLALMYADDVSSFSETSIQLQRQINCISKFCENVNMQINLSKTKVIVFRNGGPLRSYEKWYYKNELIETVSAYKYLGMFMTPKLVWSTTHEYASKQAQKAVSCIFRYQRSFGLFYHRDIFKLFDCMIKPILCYGAEIWGFQYVDRIEKVQISFCKQYCGLPQQTANVFVYGECGRLPLCITYMPRCIKYWLTILRMGSDRYPRQCYNMLKLLDDNGRKNWASNVRMLLFSYGFGYIWLAQDVGDINYFLNVFKQRIHDCYKQKWHELLHTTSKADTYNGFKSALEPEMYLSSDLTYPYRQILAKFRCSAHCLLIETGRHSGIDRNLRYCPTCREDNTYVVESEYHFFYECSTYEDLRMRLFSASFLRNRNIHSFNRIMSSSNISDIHIVARFLFLAFEKRKSMVHV